MCFLVRSKLGFVADEELDRYWRCLVYLASESDRNINSKHIAWRVHLVNDPVWENTVSLVHVKLEQRIKAVPAATGVESELREGCSPDKKRLAHWKNQKVCMRSDFTLRKSAFRSVRTDESRIASFVIIACKQIKLKSLLTPSRGFLFHHPFLRRWITPSRVKEIARAISGQELRFCVFQQ